MTISATPRRCSRHSRPARSIGWREQVAARWDRDFDFPAIRDGRVVKSEIANGRPSGIMGLVMNTRNPLFADWRVRQAMIEGLQLPLHQHDTVGGKDPRISSYFSNSELAMTPGPAQGVSPSCWPLCPGPAPGTIEGYALPEGGERAIDRQGIRAAILGICTMQDGPCRMASCAMRGATPSSSRSC